jgi:hypothetical protein
VPPRPEALEEEEPFQFTEGRAAPKPSQGRARLPKGRNVAELEPDRSWEDQEGSAPDKRRPGNRGALPYLLVGTALCGLLVALAVIFRPKNAERAAANPPNTLESTSQSGGKTPLGQSGDADVARLLATKPKAEARAWLSEEGKKRTCFKLGKKRVLELVDKLYALGAKEVLQVDPEYLEETKTEYITQLVVVLPEDSGKRKSLFEWYREFGDDQSTDRGQKYLQIPLD